jgi:hypothetical protein
VSSTPSLPIADAPLLAPGARRIRLFRAGLTAGLGLLVGAAVTLAPRGGAERTLVVPSAPTTEIVLDVSGSVGDSSFAVAGRAIERLSHGRAPVGLVLFSDSAEEALPPGSPPSELRPFARALTPPRQWRRGETRRLQEIRAEVNPWYPSFSGGTRMSAGLAAAARALSRDRIKGRILLLSDLGDAPDDRAQLRRVLVSLAQANLDVRVLTLPNALAADRKWFAELEGRDTLLTKLPEQPAARAATSSRPAFPTRLAVVAVLLAIVLAANELVGRSLRWRRT